MDETLRKMVEIIDTDKAMVQQIQASVKAQEARLLQYLIENQPELISIKWHLIRRQLGMVKDYKHQHKHINRD